MRQEMQVTSTDLVAFSSYIPRLCCKVPTHFPIDQAEDVSSNTGFDLHSCGWVKILGAMDELDDLWLVGLLRRFLETEIEWVWDLDGILCRLIALGDLVDAEFSAASVFWNNINWQGRLPQVFKFVKDSELFIAYVLNILTY